MISIIVPIYKVEKFLPKCIESILNQTYSDFELILVDDGSPDKCPEICDEYAAKDDKGSGNTLLRVVRATGKNQKSTVSECIEPRY